MTLTVGKKAPWFVLQDVSGEEIKLSQLIKEWPVVVVFTMRDDCQRCCKETMETLAGDYWEFQEKGAEVAVINNDSVESHQEWVKAHGELPYRFLSDSDLKVARKYHVVNKAGTHAKHATFIIDKDRTIRHIVPRCMMTDEELYFQVFDIIEAINIDIFQKDL